ncbi:MAG: radical SAM protein, partial [Nitrososphaerales archaeon]
MSLPRTSDRFRVRPLPNALVARFPRTLFNTKNGRSTPEPERVHYFIILTKQCNLFCTYCGGGSDTPPREIQYPIADLKSFLSKDTNPVIEFYGGEPLLRIRTMKRIMDEIPGRFVVQTNGWFLDRIEPEYLARFHSILVSVDGTREVTDKERGKRV